VIQSHVWRRSEFSFIPGNVALFPNSTAYTVIVGKNGTGKSRLMRSVVKAIVSRIHPEVAFDRDDTNNERVGGLSMRGSEPSKVICVSTSPFDKFPIVRRTFSGGAYAYLGLRGLPSQNLGLAYLSKTFSSLLPALQTPGEHTIAVDRVLSYLNYAPLLIANYSPTLPPSRMRALTESGDITPLREYVTAPRIGISDGGYAHKQLADASETDLRSVGSSLRAVLESTERGRIDLFYGNGRLHAQHLSSELLPHVLRLVDVGLLRLRSLFLRKEGSDDLLRISDASSGEQSVLMGLLGIASQIQSNSLICIDEPEVCLHPAWQQRYIHLLMSLFGGFRGCQFLVATHSPQIVAELDQTNCFILNMEDGAVCSAKEFAHKSADFQLAHVFRAPGHSNEYVVRSALSLLATIGRLKRVDDADRGTLEFLLSIIDSLPPADPARALIESLREVASRYA
jgi:predicted ATPase